MKAHTPTPTPHPDEFDLDHFLAEYHASHDCNPGPCMCKCGCTQQIGCRALGGLCSVCHVRYGRDDEDHGFREEGAAPTESAKEDKRG